MLYGTAAIFGSTTMLPCIGVLLVFASTLLQVSGTRNRQDNPPPTRKATAKPSGEVRQSRIGRDDGKQRPNPGTTRSDGTTADSKPSGVQRQPSARESAFQRRIRACLAHYLFRPETTGERSPWGAMHAMLPFGVEAELVADGRRVNTIGWLCYNGRCRGQNLFVVQGDRFSLPLGPGVQGHEGQFLAMLAQSLVPRTYPIKVQGKQFTVEDLIQYEMATCRENSELTFKLIALAHYLPPDEEWKCRQGKDWSIRKLVAEEVKQPLVGAACGGAHRLMGLSYACRRRVAKELPLDGSFQKARELLDASIERAFSLQNPDGSFSTDWFAGRGNQPDMDRKVQTTGHILEWLVYELPENRLRDPRITRAVSFLLGQIWDDRDHDWAIGPRSHTLRALVLYDQKVFHSQPGKRRELLAQYVKRGGTRR